MTTEPADHRTPAGRSRRNPANRVDRTESLLPAPHSDARLAANADRGIFSACPSGNPRAAADTVPDAAIPQLIPPIGGTP